MKEEKNEGRKKDNSIEIIRLYITIEALNVIHIIMLYLNYFNEPILSKMI